MSRSFLQFFTIFRLYIKNVRFKFQTFFFFSLYYFIFVLPILDTFGTRANLKQTKLHITYSFSSQFLIHSYAKFISTLNLIPKYSIILKKGKKKKFFLKLVTKRSKIRSKLKETERTIKISLKENKSFKFRLFFTNFYRY